MVQPAFPVQAALLSRLPHFSTSSLTESNYHIVHKQVLLNDNSAKARCLNCQNIPLILSYYAFRGRVMRRFLIRWRFFKIDEDHAHERWDGHAL